MISRVRFPIYDSLRVSASVFLVSCMVSMLMVVAQDTESGCHSLHLDSLYEGTLSTHNQSHCFQLNSDQFGDGNNTFQVLFDDHHSKSGKYLCGTVQYYSHATGNETSVLTDVVSMCMGAMEDRDGGASPFCFNVDKATTSSVLINVTCVHHYFGANKSAENNCELIPDHITWALRVLRGCDDIYTPASLTWLIVLVWIFVVFIILVLIRHVVRRWKQTRQYVEIPSSHVHIHVPDSSFVPDGTTAPTNPALRSFMGYTAPPQK
jgi:hypothetical protein